MPPLGRVMTPLDALRITELGLEQVVRHAPVAIAIIDVSGELLLRNERAESLMARLGREMPYDLSGPIDIFHPDGHAYTRDEWPFMRSLRSGEEVVDEEFFYALPDGERLFVRCGCSPVRDESGEIVAAVGAVADVTEDRHVAERLACYDRLLESSEDAVIAVDPQLRITLWSQAERLYGWRAEEVLGRDSIELWRPLLSREVNERFNRDFDFDGRSRMELSVQRRDGSRVDVEWIVDALRGAQGEDFGRLGIHRDVSERNHSQEALHTAQRHNRAMVESITDAFYSVDRDFRITYINQRAVDCASQLSGRELTRDRVLGMTLWELLPELVGSALEDRFRRVMDDRQAATFEHSCPGRDPWFEVHAYPFADGLSIYFQDISSRKPAELERARRERQQALVAELGLRALAGEGVQALMDEAVALVADVLDAELAFVMEPTPGARTLRLRAGVGWDPDTIGSTTVAAGRGSLVGYTVGAGEPVASADVRATRASPRPSFCSTTAWSVAPRSSSPGTMSHFVPWGSSRDIAGPSPRTSCTHCRPSRT